MALSAVARAVQAASPGPALVGVDAELVLLFGCPGPLVWAGDGDHLLPLVIELLAGACAAIRAKLEEGGAAGGRPSAAAAAGPVVLGGCPAGQANGRLGPRSRPCSRVREGGAGTTKAAAGGRGGRRPWPGGHAGPGRDDCWWLVGRPLGRQPRPGSTWQPGEPTAAPPSPRDQQGESVGQRRSHAKPRRRGHQPGSGPLRASPTRRRPPGN
jgi:hypothetical protein